MDTGLWNKLLPEFKDQEKLFEKIKNIISDHFSSEYEYLVGNFRNANQAKSAKSGAFVTIAEVIEYLQKRGNKN